MKHVRKSLAAVALFGLAPLVGCDQGIDDASTETPTPDTTRQPPPVDTTEPARDPPPIEDPGGLEDPTSGG